MKKTLFTFLTLFLTTLGFTQVQNGTFSINPPTFGETDEITVTVSNIDPSAWGVSAVYLWAWYFDDPTSTSAINSPTNGTWENSN